MSFQKWLRIVIPEIQLIDFIQKEGFRGKKQKMVQDRQVSVRTGSGNISNGSIHARVITLGSLSQVER